METVTKGSYEGLYANKMYNSLYSKTNNGTWHWQILAFRKQRDHIYTLTPAEMWMPLRESRSNMNSWGWWRHKGVFLCMSMVLVCYSVLTVPMSRPFTSSGSPQGESHWGLGNAENWCLIINDFQCQVLWKNMWKTYHVENKKWKHCHSVEWPDAAVLMDIHISSWRQAESTQGWWLCCPVSLFTYFWALDLSTLLNRPSRDEPKCGTVDGQGRSGWKDFWLIYSCHFVSSLVSRETLFTRQVCPTIKGILILCHRSMRSAKSATSCSR